MKMFHIALALIMFLGVFSAAVAQTIGDSSAPSASVQDRVGLLESELKRLEAEIQTLKRETGAQTAPEPSKTVFREQIIVPGLGSDERDHELQAKPEIFIQTRFSRSVLGGADLLDTDHNFQLTRLETRWAGRISARVGVGFELALHPLLH